MCKSIPKFEYSDEITDFIIFKRLNDSVSQVRLFLFYDNICVFYTLEHRGHASRPRGLVIEVLDIFGKKFEGKNNIRTNNPRFPKNISKDKNRLGFQPRKIFLEDYFFRRGLKNLADEGCQLLSNYMFMTFLIYFL